MKTPLELFRLGLDTLSIAKMMGATEPEIYNAMHAQRQEEYRIARRPHEKALHVLAFNRRFGVGR